MNTETEVVLSAEELANIAAAEVRMDAEILIESLRDFEVPDAAIRVSLAKKEFDAELIAELLPKVKRISFANEFYAFLIEAPRSPEEVAAIITRPENSDNIKVANLKHYTNIGNLVAEVRVKIAADLILAAEAAAEADLED